MNQKEFILLFLVLLSVAIIIAALLSLMPYRVVVDVTKYPDKPITVIVPTGPGGSPDLMVRAMEKSAMRHLGQPLIVVNKPGGAATLGWNELAGATPDGYTLGATATGLLLQPMYGPTRYHYMSALEPLAQVVTLPIVMAVNADSPWQNINDLVKYAKQHPGELKCGNPGWGSPTHIVAEMFAKETGTEITQVPFSDSPEAVVALMGGHIQLMFMSVPELQEQIRSGRVRVLAVATEKRLTNPLLKDVPTLKEQGLNITFSLWHGLAAPKSIPKEVEDKIVVRLQEVVADPEFKQYMENLGMTVEYLGPDDCKYKWLAENEKLSNFIKESGIAELVAQKKY